MEDKRAYTDKQQMSHYLTEIWLKHADYGRQTNLVIGLQSKKSID